MLEMIATLERRPGLPRASNGDVNYSVRKFEGYGKLSGKSDRPAARRRARRRARWQGGPAGLRAVEVRQTDGAGRRQVGQRLRQPSPRLAHRVLGMGCSLLGEHFDIHGGGLDLIFPHHERDRAERGANGHRFVNVWMHNSFLNVDNVKMSKSLGNFSPSATCSSTSMARRSASSYCVRTTAARSTSARCEPRRRAQRLRRLYTALDGIEVPAMEVDWGQPQAAAFRSAMNDDFNTPVAFAVLFDLAGELNRTRSPQTAAFKGLGATLGVLQQEVLN